MTGQEDLEVQITARVRDALAKAANSTGRAEFSRIAGISQGQLDRFLSTEEFVPMTVVSLACKLNKANADPDPERTSITECIRGATIRVPQAHSTSVPRQTIPPSARPRRSALERQRVGPMMDQKSARLSTFAFNTVTFLILGYVLGGYTLGPLFGSPSCDVRTPCLGSVAGLGISAIASLAYTFYYFVKRM